MDRLLYIFLFLFLLSCGSEEELKDEVKIESMPEVNLQEYDTIHYVHQFLFLVPKDYSVSTKTLKDSRLSYNNLINEEHVFVSFQNKDEYQASIDARKIIISKDSVFINYADEQFSELKRKVTELKIEEEYLAMVKERQTKYFRLSGVQSGFPKRKSVSLRCYEGKRHYYSIYYWTLANKHTSFETKEDVIMMSFDEIKKGQPES
jgi:hypothetical protein